MTIDARNQTALDAIDAVLGALENHREEVTRRLFPGDSPGKVAYRFEWNNRDPWRYWSHLDLSNQRRLLAIARDIYGLCGAG